MGKGCNKGVVRSVALGGLVALLSGCSTLTIPDVVTPVKRVLEPLGRSFDTRTYVVQPGDNLAYIAWRYQTTVDELLLWNGLADGSSIRAGDPLQVRPPRNGVVLARAPQPASQAQVQRIPQPQPHVSDTVTSPVAASEPLESQLIVAAQPRVGAATRQVVPQQPQVFVQPTENSAQVVQTPRVVQAPQVVQVEPVVEPTGTAIAKAETGADQATLADGDLIQVSTASRDGLQWAWPQRGKIVRSFSPSDSSQQGIDIAAGSAEPIRAAADGIVAFAGNEVSVLGRTIIIDHQKDFLSAYAKVGKLLVEEGDTVRVGDVIAESDVGSGDGQFHFQIRRKGEPLNPLKYLPKGN
ncbi:MAG: peptidoglycan DD-metalloendopeptidase family protein [Pseudomonadota bacterium]